jgi:hypothetical protein
MRLFGVSVFHTGRKAIPQLGGWLESFSITESLGIISGKKWYKTVSEWDSLPETLTQNVKVHRLLIILICMEISREYIKHWEHI